MTGNCCLFICRAQSFFFLFCFQTTTGDSHSSALSVVPQGYLFLASPESEATLRRNHATQRACGVTWTTLLSPFELKARFPWIDTDGVALGWVVA